MTRGCCMFHLCHYIVRSILDGISLGTSDDVVEIFVFVVEVDVVVVVVFVDVAVDVVVVVLYGCDCYCLNCCR